MVVGVRFLAALALALWIADALIRRHLARSLERRAGQLPVIPPL